MAEWLRRVIRNHLGSSRVGSNPAHSVLLRSYKKTKPVSVTVFKLNTISKLAKNNENEMSTQTTNFYARQFDYILDLRMRFYW